MLQEFKFSLIFFVSVIATLVYFLNPGVVYAIVTCASTDGAVVTNPTSCSNTTPACTQSGIQIWEGVVTWRADNGDACSKTMAYPGDPTCTGPGTTSGCTGTPPCTSDSGCTPSEHSLCWYNTSLGCPGQGGKGSTSSPGACAIQSCGNKICTNNSGAYSCATAWADGSTNYDTLSCQTTSSGVAGYCGVAATATPAGGGGGATSTPIPTSCASGTTLYTCAPIADGSYQWTCCGYGTSGQCANNNTTITCVSGGNPGPTAVPDTSVPSCDSMTNGSNCNLCTVECGGTGIKRCAYNMRSDGASCDPVYFDAACSEACSAGYRCVSNNCKPLYSISGSIFNDINRNGIKDGAETNFVAPIIVPTATSTPTPTPTPPPLQSNLVSYWRLDETTNGATVVDDKGNNDGDPKNTTVTSSGKIGYARVFGGANGQYVDMGNNASLKPAGNQLSLAAWFKCNYNNANQSIVSKYNGSGYALLATTLNRIRAILTINGVYKYIEPNNTACDGAWHHVVMTYDGSNYKVYIDGSLGTGQNTISASGNISYDNSKLNLGSQNGALLFNGTIDEVGLWNVGLTSSDIATLYNGGSGQRALTTPTPTPIPTNTPTPTPVTQNITFANTGTGSETQISTTNSVFTSGQTLLAGTYRVSYTNPPTPDYEMTEPLTIPPPSFTVVVGPSCSVGSSRSASCLSGNISNLNFGISNAFPWWQACGMNIVQEAGITNKVPSTSVCTPYAITSCAGSDSIGIAYSGTNSSNFGKGEVSTTGQIVGGSSYPETFSAVNRGIIRTSYDYYITTARNNGITLLDLSTVCGSGGINNCELPSALPNGAYKASGDTTLSSATGTYTFQSNKNFVILIDGTLTIKTRIVTPVGSTLSLYASKDIIVDPSVRQSALTCAGSVIPACDLQGNFSADRNFQINGSSDCTDKPICISGSVIANAGQLPSSPGRFINNRDLCESNLTNPSVIFQPRNDFLLNAPRFIQATTRVWKEVAP